MKTDDRYDPRDQKKRAEHGSQYEMIRRRIAKKNAVATPPSGRIEKAAMITEPR